MRLALALDLGTTSTSVVAVDEQGVTRARCSRAHQADRTDVPAGCAEQDPLRHWDVALSLLRDVATQLAGVPECLAITGQMHGVLLTDAALNPLTRLVTWQDRRTLQLQADGRPFLESLLERCPDAALSVTGTRLASGYGAATLAFWNAHDALPRGSAAALTLADWVSCRLTDAPPVTDRSNAAAWGSYDLANDCWSEALCAEWNIPLGLLPEVHESGAVRGDLLPEVALQTGLPSGLPVCVPVGDNQAAVLGSSGGDPDVVQINIGTGGQISWAVDAFVAVPGMDTRYLPHERFMLVGAGVAGGDAYAWCNRTIRQWLAECGVTRPSEDVYAIMQRCVRDLPDDAERLTCQPLFRGTRRRPDVRGAIGGISNENLTIGNLCRAVLQGIVDGLGGFLTEAGSARPATPRCIVASGNALRENPLLIELLEASFGLDVFLTETAEEASRGTALLGGTAVGLWPTLHEATSTTKVVRAPASEP